MKDWLKKYDVFRKLSALFLSIILWFVIMDRVNPDMTFSFRNVRVTLRGETDLLNTRNYSIVSGDGQTVSFKLRGKRNALMHLSKADLSVVANVSQIDSTGEIAILCEVRAPGEGITVIDPHLLKITVVADEMVEESIPLRKDVTGTPAEGFRKGREEFPQTVAVRGARTEVSRIAYARVSVDIAGRTATLKDAAPAKTLQFFDHSGRQLSLYHTLTKEDGIPFSIEINAVRELPLTIQLTDGGGLTADRVTCSILPETITVMGSPDILNSIESISLGTLNLDVIGLEPFQTEKLIVLSGGIESLSEQTIATVSVAVKNIETGLVPVSDVRFSGDLPRGLSASWQDVPLSIRLRGNRYLLAEMTEDDLEVSVNLSELAIAGPGTFTAPVSVSVRGGLNAVVLGEYTVELTVKKST